jgi:glutamate-1-semialdehyde 2,1-aminomutase
MAVAETLVAPYNVVPDIDDRVACVIVEAVAANMGLVPPAHGFLRDLRAACDAAGALLVFDEVITGFRLRNGSIADLVGVRPDLWTFGKVIGGGLPLAVLGGRSDIMAELAPLGPVYQAGTLSGNPLATAAGLAVLERLSEERFSDLAGRVSRLAGGLREAIASAGLPVQVPVYRTLFAIFFADSLVSDYDGAKAANAGGLYAPFFHAMLDRGVALAPSGYEVGFCSMAHTDGDVERTVEAAGEAAREVAGRV